MKKRELNFLVIDDNPNDLAKAMSIIHGSSGKCFGASNIEEAYRALKEHHIDVLLTDIHLTDQDKSKTPKGIHILETVSHLYPHIIPLAMSSDPKEQIATEATDVGALQFLKKPIDNWDILGIAVKLAIKAQMLQRSHKFAKSTIKLPADLMEKYPDGIVISQHLRQRLQKMAKYTHAKIVFKGETGTGKEEMAKIIHRQRCLLEKKEIPLIAINCSHLKRSTAHSELFGHKKGSFTGANATTNGYITNADGGILFLDEIQNLPIDCQQDLLRVLNDGTYNRVGDSENSLKSDFQLIVATTKDLDEEVEIGNLLIDLRGRITGLNVDIPPLRERKEDIDDLVRMFFAKKKNKVKESEIKRISDKCKEYYWQTNIRGLMGALETLVIECDMEECEISYDYLPEYKQMLEPAKNGKSGNTHSCPRSPVIPLNKSMNENIEDCTSMILDAFNGKAKLADTTRIIEKAIISHHLQKDRVVTSICKKLDVSRSTFDQKRKKYGLY